MKRLSEEEIENFPLKNVIVRALGMKSTVKVDTVLDRPEIGDVYVLCSDGLCGPVSPIREIQRIVGSHHSPICRPPPTSLIDIGQRSPADRTTSPWCSRR